jgi:hypothetical protein
MFYGKSELEHFEQCKAERISKRQKASERHHQKSYIASTNLQKVRVDRLEKLKTDAKHEEEVMQVSSIAFLASTTRPPRASCTEFVQNALMPYSTVSW